jgi:membrane protein implicated in regulation of membrane protease activity
MAEMFSTLGSWNWLIFGFVLMALELLAPGYSCSGSGLPPCWSGCCRL